MLWVTKSLCVKTQGHVDVKASKIAKSIRTLWASTRITDLTGDHTVVLFKTFEGGWASPQPGRQLGRLAQTVSPPKLGGQILGALNGKVFDRQRRHEIWRIATESFPGRKQAVPV